jgi:lipoprotein-anchoring transpeptidase ErfK/SrfK
LKGLPVRFFNLNITPDRPILILGVMCNMRSVQFLVLLLFLFLAACARIPTPPPEIGADERWIEVDKSAQMVRLHDGEQVIGEYPAATGVNTFPETTTYTGIFKVKQMMEGPVESVPGVYVTDVVIFDLAHGNGLHSMPMDKDKNILDDTLGKPATAGCVRVGESAAVFAFAKLGMKVWVH